MTQLIDLVRADSLEREVGPEGGKVALAAADEPNTRAGEGDLGCGPELENAVHSPELARVGGDAGQSGGVILQGVYRVGVVPHDDKVGGRDLRQACEALYSLRTVDAAGGVGKAGYTPDALDIGVGGNQGLHLVHIRA